MNKRQHCYREWLQTLRNAGWQVEKSDSVRFNDGGAGETAKHLHGKLAAAKVLKNNNYRISTEVVHEGGRGEIDVCAVPTQDDQKPFAVELETSPTQDVIDDKLSRYYDGTPFTECWVINVSELPLNILEMEQQIADKLGLEL